MLLRGINMEFVRGRGEDFSGNLRMSRWAEDKAITGFTSTDYIAVHFGASSSSDETLISMDRERKEPDLLVYRREDLSPEQSEFIESMNKLTEKEDNNTLHKSKRIACKNFKK